MTKKAHCSSFKKGGEQTCSAMPYLLGQSMRLSTHVLNSLKHNRIATTVCIGMILIWIYLPSHRDRLGQRGREREREREITFWIVFSFLARNICLRSPRVLVGWVPCSRGQASCTASSFFVVVPPAWIASRLLYCWWDFPGKSSFWLYDYIWGWYCGRQALKPW